VFRQRLVTLRAGYRYVHEIGSGSGDDFEHRGILELNLRYALPGKIVLSDRNRGEFRFIQGKPFSTRYRNRVGLERDLAIGAFKMTPEIFVEFFYDTRYSAWSRVRYKGGLQLPAGRHVVWEPYAVWQVNKQSNPRHTAALGLTLNLYL
jgi:hypothetical protein